MLDELTHDRGKRQPGEEPGRVAFSAIVNEASP